MGTYKLFTAKIKTHFETSRTMKANAVTEARAKAYFSEFGEVLSITKEQHNAE